jgi:hypothetical protein
MVANPVTIVNNCLQHREHTLPYPPMGALKLLAPGTSLPLRHVMGLARVLLYPVSVLCRYLRGCAGFGLLTFAGFLEELERLGLKGETFGPRDYADALADELRITIAIELVEVDTNPEAALAFRREDKAACVWYDQAANLARVLVLSNLPPLEMTAAIYHELGHLAAGDPLVLYGLGKPVNRVEVLPRRLARRSPAMRRKVVETEAWLRENYALTAGALGSLCLESESLKQLS